MKLKFNADAIMLLLSPVDDAVSSGSGGDGSRKFDGSPSKAKQLREKNQRTTNVELDESSDEEEDEDYEPDDY